MNMKQVSRVYDVSDVDAKKFNLKNIGLYFGMNTARFESNLLFDCGWCS